ncbi:hypothetical protein BU16DRAFT_525794 [Lophium mytilinum]|uniref:Heterokaryon incompatibility domain-containing protein n=1 Tax=Lophium mytilinum TaxID=390894 RepID=A0A6A6QVY8_9PEZI|nr:hypothetical protein BU16DRAFT_525794 [Lophium mytilinum]
MSDEDYDSDDSTVFETNVNFDASDTEEEESDTDSTDEDENFIHTPLRDPTRYIRLLKVQSAKKGFMPCCTIRHFKKDEAPDYRALSYCWGPEEYWEIEVNDAPFGVRENLQDVLEHIAEFQYYKKGYNITRWWWIDALCIMQDKESEAERLAQLGIMRSIYATAVETIAWLGPGNRSTTRAMKYITQLPLSTRKNMSDDTMTIANDDFCDDIEETFARDPRFAKAIDDIFTREYWERIWILQELAVSQNTTLVCGDGWLKWDQLVEFSINVAIADFSERRLRQARRKVMEKQPVWLISKMYRKSQSSTNGFSLATLIYLSEASKATRSVDYVHALLGMVVRGEGLRMKPSNTTKYGCETLCEAIRVMLKDMPSSKSWSEAKGSEARRKAKAGHHKPLSKSSDIRGRRKSCKGISCKTLQIARKMAAVLYSGSTLYHIGRTEQSMVFYRRSVERRRPER